MTTSKKASLKAEVEKPLTVSFEFDGEEYTVKTDVMDDLDVMEATESQKYVAAAKAILGPAQWARFRSKPRNYSVDLSNMLNEIFSAVAGATPGE